LTKRLLLGKAPDNPISWSVSALMWKLAVVVPEVTGTTVSVVPVPEAEDTRDFWAIATGVPSRVV
jgi:hypothetical protein